MGPKARDSSIARSLRTIKETTVMTAAMEAGADEYLMKPFEKEALVDKIQMVGLTPPNGGAGA